MTILNLKEIMELAEKIELETKFVDYLNEKELAKFGVELVNTGGERVGLLGNLVLTHIESGMTAQQIVDMAFNVKEYVKGETEELRMLLKKEQEYSTDVIGEVVKYAKKVEELERELPELKGEVKPKKKRGRKPKAKVEEVSKEEKEIIDFTKRYNSPKVSIPVKDEDIPF